MMADSVVQLHGLDTGSENFALGYTAGLEAGSAATTPVPERKRAAEVLPASNLPPVAGSLEQAAALIGVSPNTYLEMTGNDAGAGTVRSAVLVRLSRCSCRVQALELAMHECNERKRDADAAR